MSAVRLLATSWQPRCSASSLGHSSSGSTWITWQSFEVVSFSAYVIESVQIERRTGLVIDWLLYDHVTKPLHSKPAPSSHQSRVSSVNQSKKTLMKLCCSWQPACKQAKFDCNFCCVQLPLNSYLSINLSRCVYVCVCVCVHVCVDCAQVSV